VGRRAALAMAEAALTRTPSSPSSMSVAIMHLSSGSSQKTGAAVTAVVVVRTRRRAAGFLRPQLQIISVGPDCRRAGAFSQSKDQHVGPGSSGTVSLRLRSLAATYPNCHLISSAWLLDPTRFELLFTVPSLIKTKQKCFFYVSRTQVLVNQHTSCSTFESGIKPCNKAWCEAQDST
jgi:hypothetical protein